MCLRWLFNLHLGGLVIQPPFFMHNSKGATKMTDFTSIPHPLPEAIEDAILYHPLSREKGTLDHLPFAYKRLLLHFTIARQPQ